MSAYAAFETLKRGPSMLIMFWFEYTLVGFGLLAAIVKYCLNVAEVRAGGWDHKGVWVMYVSANTSFVSFLLFSIAVVSSDFTLLSRVLTRPFLFVQSLPCLCLFFFQIFKSLL